MKEFNIDIPIQDKHTMLIDGVVQYDSDDAVKVTLLSNGTPYNFSAYTQIQLSIIKPDGTVISTVINANESLNTENPFDLTVVDATAGRVDFNLKGQATIVQGVYTARLIIYNAGALLSSSRINYHVEQSQDNIPTEQMSGSDFSVLLNLIASCSDATTKEALRVIAENARVTAENSRVVSMQQMQNQAQTLFNRADQIKNECEVYAERAEAAAEPAEDAIEAVLTEMGWPTQQNVQAWIDAKFALGIDGNTVPMQVKRGTEAAITALSVGVLYLCTDTHNLYIGTADGNVKLTQHFSSGSSAPTRTDILWIDTSANNAIKAYIGSTWTALTATAVFS